MEASGPYDCRTPTDRERLDAAVLKALPRSGIGLTRGQVANALGNGATTRMVGASLGRLVEREKASKGGAANAPTYTKKGAST